MSVFSMVSLGVALYMAYKLWVDGTSITGRIICIGCLAGLASKIIL